METTPLHQDAKALSIALAKRASVTDSAGEKAFAPYLRSVIARVPYFRKEPGDLSLLPIPEDPKGRSNLFALVRGKGTSCVVLSGHYDVVQTSMYGGLEPLAFDPEALRDRLLSELTDLTGKDNPRHKLKEDLESGEFLPGRGILDMKSGLAAGIVVLSRFSAAKEREGNLLFMAVADEEGSSRGMKAAAPVLKAFLAEQGLRAAAVFNLDSAVDQEIGESGRALFTGSVGKTLPFVLFVGKSAHAGSPFDGINPVLPASEFARAVECNPDAFKERQAMPGEEPSPPSILYFRETRESYDVTTPASVFCALNVLSYTSGPETILETIGKLASAAMDGSISLLRERASTFSRRMSGHFSLPVRTPTVLRFDEFAAETEKVSPGACAAARLTAQQQHPDDKVLQTLSVLTTLLSRSGLEGPAAVVGFAPPYYARAELNKERDAEFLACMRTELSALSTERRMNLKLRPYFPGISDMSFLAPADSAEERSFVRSQTPVADLSSDEATRTPLGCPVVNLGPWGREYHQAGERVQTRYAFAELPVILERLVASTLTLEAPNHEN
ncbi:MAG: M20/M25/M40 family metallo-hydrolase [Spirochaetes bacterium]|nr:M20/M25/M40 family metallo-hydrolase [Spirochaetota bacterium]